MRVTIYSLLILVFAITSFAYDIVKENDNLFYAKLNDDLFFVAERLTNKNYKTWKGVFDTQKEILEYMQTNIRSFRKGDESLKTSEPEEYKKLLEYEKSEKMMGSIADALEKLRTINGTNAERWIIYAFNEQPVTLSSSNVDEKIDKIEMMMAVATDEEVPFTSHMGIARAPIHIYENKAKHGQIAARFHAFAAKIMRELHGNNKIYMITTPLPEMKNILAKSLPEGSVFVGDQETNDQSPLRQTGYVTVYGSSDNFTFQIMDQNKKIIFTMDPKNAAIKHWWFFKIMTPTNTTPYVIVDLESLSKLFDK